jgi:hypothetical protein
LALPIDHAVWVPAQGRDDEGALIGFGKAGTTRER